jgi:hypothetical protein
VWLPFWHFIELQIFMLQQGTHYFCIGAIVIHHRMCCAIVAAQNIGYTVLFLLLMYYLKIPEELFPDIGYFPRYVSLATTKIISRQCIQ